MIKQTTTICVDQLQQIFQQVFHPATFDYQIVIACPLYASLIHFFWKAHGRPDQTWIPSPLKKTPHATKWYALLKIHISNLNESPTGNPESEPSTKPWLWVQNALHFSQGFFALKVTF